MRHLCENKLLTIRNLSIAGWRFSMSKSPLGAQCLCIVLAFQPHGGTYCLCFWPVSRSNSLFHFLLSVTGITILQIRPAPETTRVQHPSRAQKGVVGGEWRCTRAWRRGGSRPSWWCSRDARLLPNISDSQYRQVEPCRGCRGAEPESRSCSLALRWLLPTRGCPRRRQYLAPVAQVS